MTMKTFKLAILFLAALLLPSLSLAQQNYLGQTTLSGAIPGQYLGPGSTGNVPAPTIITVTSATSIVGANPNLAITASQPNFQTQLYVDRELMTVINVSGTALTVVRGAGGTVATPHSNGAMVLFGPPRFFYSQDPGASAGNGPGSASYSNVPCILANVLVSPWLNVRTGGQWYCNPSTLVWTSGFNNPMLFTGASFSTVASVAGAQPIPGPVSKISGTNAITSFTFTGNGAIGLNGAATANSQSGGEFCIIPTGAFTTTATNNIGAATTAIAGVMQCWVWNGTDAKWYQLP